MILPLLLFLALAACIPAPAAPPAPSPVAKPDRLIDKGRGPRDLVYIVDGTKHTQRSFAALNLGQDDFEVVEVIKCTDYCTRPRVVIIRTHRSAAPPTP